MGSDPAYNTIAPNATKINWQDNLHRRIAECGPIYDEMRITREDSATIEGLYSQEKKDPHRSTRTDVMSLAELATPLHNESEAPKLQ